MQMSTCKLKAFEPPQIYDNGLFYIYASITVFF